MSVATILNTIRANATADYQARIPIATRENLTAVGNAILNYSGTQNEYLSLLLNKIALTEVLNRQYVNKFAGLKKDGLTFGSYVEQSSSNPTKSKEYNATGGASEYFAVSKPETVVAVHEINRQGVFALTIYDVEMRKAFISEQNFMNFYNKIISDLYSGDAIDEELLINQLFGSAITATPTPKMVTIELDAVTDETTGKAFVKTLKELSTNFETASTEYNKYKDLSGSAYEFMTWTPKENQILILRSDIDASIDVDVLAVAFNMDKTTLLANKIVIPYFINAPKCMAVLIDNANFEIRDTLVTLKTAENGASLYTQFWLHHQGIISLSPLYNAVAILEKTEG